MGSRQQFDELRLIKLFKNFHAVEIDYIVSTRELTNGASEKLYDFAGNPYGTFAQEECCIYCGCKLLQPPPCSVAQRILSKLAYSLARLQQTFSKPHANWIHILFRKEKFN